MRKNKTALIILVFCILMINVSPVTASWDLVVLTDQDWTGVVQSSKYTWILQFTFISEMVENESFLPYITFDFKLLDLYVSPDFYIQLLYDSIAPFNEITVDVDTSLYSAWFNLNGGGMNDPAVGNGSFQFTCWRQFEKAGLYAVIIYHYDTPAEIRVNTKIYGYEFTEPTSNETTATETASSSTSFELLALITGIVYLGLKRRKPKSKIV